MPILFQYLLKVSISLAIMYVFYQLVLRRLTFYDHNRWYLFGYSVLCYFISFINIGPILQNGGGESHELFNMVPSVGALATGLSESSAAVEADSGWSIWDWATLVLAGGTVLFIARLIIQLVSFKRLKAGARLVSGTGIKFYQVNRNIIPFSFGNSIYINQNLHTESELKEIIRHEFVHVKQKHTLDIIWGELLCIVNWYNPFAWLIRRAIRQNLEFIADNKVIANGIDKKQYQYLLLKVIGNNHFSIASQFNFTSLKKRIVMMNKIKTAKVHLFKFLFMLPLLAVILIAFRSSSTNTEEPVLRYASMVIDGDTKEPLANVKVVNLNTNKQARTDERGYFKMELPANRPIHVKMMISKKGYANLETSSFSLEKINNTESIGLMEVIELKKGNALDGCVGCSSSISMREENNDDLGYSEVKKYYEKLLIGLPAFVDTVPVEAKPGRPSPTASYTLHRDDNMSDEHKRFFNRNTNINLLHWKKDGSLEVYLAGGKVQKFTTPTDFKKFESEYGPLPSPAGSTPVVSPASPVSPVSPALPSTAPGAPVPPTAPDSPVKARVNIVNAVTADAANKPLIVVDGEEWPAHLDMNLIDPNRIEHVRIWKGESATSRYGNKAKNGVIEIDVKPGVSVQYRPATTADEPAFYLNGKKISKQAVDLLDPSKIKSVDVLKGPKAIEKYGDDGKNGAVEITMPVQSGTIRQIQKPVTQAWDIQNILPGKKKDEC